MSDKEAVAEGFKKAQEDTEKIPVVGKLFSSIFLDPVNSIISATEHHHTPPPPPKPVFQPGV